MTSDLVFSCLTSSLEDQQERRGRRGYRGYRDCMVVAFFDLISARRNQILGMNPKSRPKSIASHVTSEAKEAVKAATHQDLKII